MENKIRTSTPRLLIAEDDARLRRVLSLEFASLNYEVVTISAPSEFSEKQERFDFGIIDLRLGADSGFVTMKSLKRHSPNCRFVVLTGYGSIPTAVEAIKFGAVHYLTKPAKIEEIENAFWGEEPGAEDAAERPTTLAENERDFIDSIIIQCEGNITHAAKRLGIHRQSLQRKLRKFT